MGGAPIDIRGEAITVAKDMGLLSLVHKEELTMDSMAFVDARGRSHGSMSLAKNFADPLHDIELRRDKLVTALYNGLRDDIDFIFNDSIKTITQDAEGVDVTFRNVSPQRFEYVFGADGVHSITRRLVFGNEAHFVRNLGLYTGLVELDTTTSSFAHQVQVYNSPGKMASVANYGGQSYAMFAFRSPVLSYDYHDIDQKKRLILEIFAQEANWRIPELLEEVRSSDNLYFDVVNQILMPKWSKGRVALLGDAAHCAAFLSGMGSSLAMIGAARLAQALHEHGGNYDHAFAVYERDFRPFVEKTQRGVPLAGHFLIPSTKLGIFVRNGALTAARLLPRLRIGSAPTVK
jgi:2-polyprenyl-6-methoxyphenol hydroxylase-like FAD-dependent oxidoreductase